MKELYSEKLDEVSSYMDELWQEDQRNKTQLATLWRRNVDFANGAQSFSYDGGYAQEQGGYLLFSRAKESRHQLLVGNEIEPIIRTLVSYLTRAKPGVEIFSADEDDDDRRNKARLAERVLEAKYDIDDEYTNLKNAAFWAFTIGTVFRKDFWDSTLGKDASIPVFDELGNEVIDPETGDVAIRNQKTGGNNTAILTPFSIAFDWSYTDFNELPWIQEAYMMPIDWAHEAFDKEGEGYTGQAREIKTDSSIGNGTLSTLEDLKYASPYNKGATGERISKNKVLIRELYIKPNSSFPEGRLIIKAGAQIVYAGTSPYFMPYEPVMWHPYTMFIYEPYIGRLLGKSLVEQLVPLQMRLNEIAGAIVENANTVGKVNILTPENCLKRGVINGRGGQVFSYKMVPGGGKPEKWEGTPLPTQFFKEKEDIIQQMVRIAGTNFVMQGTPPTGVTASSAIEQLLENANTQHSDLMNSWEKFYEAACTKKIRLIRKFNNLPNESLVNYLRTISRDALDQEITSFVGEDLGDGITVKVEAGSMIPKSEKLKKDMYREFAQNRLLGPIEEDSPRGARLRKELLAKFGEKGFDIEESADVEKAKWENERMKKGLFPEPWEEDNDPIHLSCHISEFKDPKFIERASDEIKQAYLEHIAWHRQNEQEKAAMQMPPVPPGGPSQEVPPEVAAGGVPPMGPPPEAMMQ